MSSLAFLLFAAVSTIYYVRDAHYATSNAQSTHAMTADASPASTAEAIASPTQMPQTSIKQAAAADDTLPLDDTDLLLLQPSVKVQFCTS